MKKDAALLYLAFVLFLVPVVYSQVSSCFNNGCHLADNTLEPLLNGEKQNWRLEVSAMVPRASESATYNQRALLNDMPETYVATINVADAAAPVKSYLYILTSDYYQAVSSTWTVKFNGKDLAYQEHSSSVGGKSRGDGELDQERQTIFFEVTGDVKSGENTLSFKDISTTNTFKFNGAVLLNFYSSDDEHQYWVYHGVEYLESFSGLEDSIYAQSLPNADYSSAREATLYTVLNNKEETNDELYFNDNLLKDKDATYIESGSNLVAKSFDVSKYLDKDDSVKFTIAEYIAEEGKLPIQYRSVPIYPSIIILDVKLPPKPKVVVLANSIDWDRASDLFGFLKNRGLEVIHATAEDFNTYKTQKFIVILGGPDAPEGIGDLIKAEQFNLKLKADEIDYIRAQGNKRKLHRSSVWTPGQSVWILAGANRELTQQAHQENKDEVAQTVETESAAIDTPTESETTVDPCPADPSNPISHNSAFRPDETAIYICSVIYSGGSSNWEIKFYNPGEEEINLKRYKIFDPENRFYQFNAYVDTNVIGSGKYYYLYSSEISTSMLRLAPSQGSLTLEDSSGVVIDKVEWNKS